MKHIIVIPFGLPWDWSAADERLAVEYFAKKSLVIAFLIHEGRSIRQLFTYYGKKYTSSQKNIYVFRPIYFLPLQRFSIIRRMNYTLARLQLRILLSVCPLYRTKKRLFWTSSLQYSVFPHDVGHIHLAMYHCVDVPLVQKNNKTTTCDSEQQMLKEVSIAFTNTDTLYKEKSHLHSTVYLVPIGFNKQAFLKKQVVSLCEKIPHPQIHFLGNINNRIDFSLLYSLIKKTPKYSYVFLGKEDPNYLAGGKDFARCLAQLKTLPNAYFLGYIPQQELSSYMMQADVGLIPYDNNQIFNSYCFPVKVLEFFYFGKPVVSSDILEIKKLYPYVKIFHSVKEARHMIQQCVSEPWPYTYQVAERRIAEENSWKNKMRVVHDIIKHKFGISI